jgi:hypothetical protein
MKPRSSRRLPCCRQPVTTLRTSRSPDNCRRRPSVASPGSFTGLLSACSTQASRDGYASATSYTCIQEKRMILKAFLRPGNFICIPYDIKNPIRSSVQLASTSSRTRPIMRLPSAAPYRRSVDRSCGASALTGMLSRVTEQIRAESRQHQARHASLSHLPAIHALRPERMACRCPGGAPPLRRYLRSSRMRTRVARSSA